VGHAIKQLPRESPDLPAWIWLSRLQIWMFRKIFELLWFDKLHVEMDLVWFWRKLWWFLFVGYWNKWIRLQNCEMLTKPVTLKVTAASRAGCVQRGLGTNTPFLRRGNRDATEDDSRPNILQLNTEGSLQTRSALSSS